MLAADKSPGDLPWARPQETGARPLDYSERREGSKDGTIADSSDGRISTLIAALIEDLVATGEWTRDAHDLRVRTVDKLYKVKE
jgi:hypothetical protein